MRLLCAIVLVVGAAIPDARAQTANDLKEAANHYRRARALYDAKSYEQAAVEFKRSYALVPKATILFNVALAYEKGGDLENALAYFKKYVEAEPSGEAAPEAREKLVQLRAATAPVPLPAPAPRQPCSSAATCVEECLQKIAASCFRAGQLAENAGPAADRKAAADLYQEGCELGAAEACLRSGRMYEDGAGIARDVGRALDFYRKGCDKGDPEACGRAGWLLHDGQGIAPNALHAFEYFRKACDRNDPRGCHGLGLAYVSGSPIPRDLVRAVSILEKSCHANEARACVALAKVFQEGHGAELPKDERRAAELYGTGCKLGLADCCFAAGKLAPAQNETFVEQGCAIQPKAAECFVELRPGEIPIGCKRDPFAAVCDRSMAKVPIGRDNLEKFVKNCATSAGKESCLKLGRMYMAAHDGEGPEPVTAAKYFRQGCDHGNGPSCRSLALLYERGVGGLEQNEPRALELYQSACTASVAESCFQVYRLLRHIGSFGAAEAAAHEGCRLGFKPACTPNEVDSSTPER